MNRISLGLSGLLRGLSGLLLKIALGSTVLMKFLGEAQRWKKMAAAAAARVQIFHSCARFFFNAFY